MPDPLGASPENLSSPRKTEENRRCEDRDGTPSKEDHASSTISRGVFTHSTETSPSGLVRRGSATHWELDYTCLDCGVSACCEARHVESSPRAGSVDVSHVSLGASPLAMKSCEGFTKRFIYPIYASTRLKEGLRNRGRCCWALLEVCMGDLAVRVLHTWKANNQKQDGCSNISNLLVSSGLQDSSFDQA